MLNTTAKNITYHLKKRLIVMNELSCVGQPFLLSLLLLIFCFVFTLRTTLIWSNEHFSGNCNRKTWFAEMLSLLNFYLINTTINVFKYKLFAYFSSSKFKKRIEYTMPSKFTSITQLLVMSHLSNVHSKWVFY